MGNGFKLLGWVSVALAVVASSPYWLRTLNNWTFKTRDKRFFALLKFLRKLHKVLGLLLAAVALYHGFMALGGRIRLHTGLLAYAAFLLTALLGIWHHFRKNKTVFKVHKATALAGFLFFALHLLEPWALGKWFGLW